MNTVFEHFKNKREKLGFSIQDVASVLRISKSHLEAIEAGRLEDLPERVYSLGFIRTYATYLKINPDEAILAYKNYDKKTLTAPTVLVPEKSKDWKIIHFFKESVNPIYISDNKLHYAILVCIIICVIFSVVR